MITKRKNLSGTLAIVTILSLSLVSVILATLLSGSKWRDWLFPAFSQLILLALLVLTSKISAFNLLEEGNFKGKISFVGTLLTLGIGVSLFFFGIGASNILLNALELAGYTVQSSMPVMNTTFSIILSIFAMAIMPAVAEESMVRGGILPGVRRSLGTTKAIIFVALFFMLMHGSLAQSVHQFMIGLFAGFLVISGKSLWYGVLLHFFNNFFVILGYLKTLDKNGIVIEMEGSTASTFFASSQTVITCIVMIIVGLVLACLFGYLFLRHRQKSVGVEHQKGFKNLEKNVDLVSPMSDDGDIVENRKEKIFFWTATIIMALLVVFDFVSKVIK